MVPSLPALMKPCESARGQQGDRRVAPEVTDLGELALAILCHLKPLGDDAVVVAHQQGGRTGEQGHLGHAGIGALISHDIAQEMSLRLWMS